MIFVGEKNGKQYELTVVGHKLERIRVREGQFGLQTYQRGPVKAGLTITKAVLEEAAIAICQKKLVEWGNLNHAIWMDEEYHQMLQEIFEKHIML